MEAESEVKKEQSPPPHHQEKTNKKEHEKKQRPKRENEHQYNADLINEDTVIPALPKKGDIIPKPDNKAYKEKEKKNSQKIEDLINKKKEIRAEKFKFSRKAQGGQGDNAFSSFNAEVSEVQQLRDRLAQVRVQSTKLREELRDGINQAKANNENIKKYKEALKGSRQNFTERLRQLEHIQMTKDLKKNQEKDINNEITLLKRRIKEAESSGNIEIKLEQAEDLKEELDEKINKIKSQKEPLDKEYDSIKGELDKRNAHITGLKSEMANEKSEKNEEKERHDKEYETWKENKQKRLDKLEDEITKIKAENSKIWDEYHKKMDDHWKQKHYIDYVEWQIRVKNRKIAEKEKEARKAEYEKRDKEREKEEQLRKYLGEIQMINFLVNYLNGLKADKGKTEEEKKETKISQSQITAKLTGDAQWKKEKVEILQSKKSKEDEEEQPHKKKNKKNKKKEEIKTEQKFVIPFNVQTMFESIKLLAPTSPEEIDAKIKELKDREALFQRVAQEESTEEEAKLAEEIKAKQGVKQEKQKKSKKVEEDEDFPTI